MFEFAPGVFTNISGFLTRPIAAIQASWPSAGTATILHNQSVAQQLDRDCYQTISTSENNGPSVPSMITSGVPGAAAVDLMFHWQVGGGGFSTGLLALGTLKFC
jgi:hypothetical protein